MSMKGTQLQCCPMFRVDRLGSSFYLETYGCSLNKADSDIMVAILSSNGYEQVSSPDDADVIILNSCGVKEPTEDRVISRLAELASSDLPIIITGCLPKISLQRIERILPAVRAILGPQSMDILNEVMRRVLDGERGIVHLNRDSSSKLQYFEGPPNSVVCTIPICEGCLGSCTYCAVRLARGSVRSYRIEEIQRVVQCCVDKGYREIRLTAQDAGVFGADTGETLHNLLRKLDCIDGPHRFRLGMFNPELLLSSLPDIIEVLESEHFFRFFHAPLQSASNQVLSQMGRKYTVEEWESLVNMIRNRLSDTTIATDIIVGFPGETDQDFEVTIDLIERIRPEVVNISKYGDRPNTPASRSKEKVPTSTRKDRSRRLSALVAEISLEQNQSWVGRTVHVLVTGEAPKGGLFCRTISYKPVIVHDEAIFGQVIATKILSAERTHLVGKFIL